MVFAKRDAKHLVCAIYEKNAEGVLEELSNDNPEVTAFLVRCALDRRFGFLKSDLELIRVIEDLIQILIEKHIISITDFPTAAIEKLVARNKIRKQFRNISHIVDDEDQN